MTFGSVTGSLPPFAGLFQEALDALSTLPLRVLMTVGRGFDLDRLGVVPDNALVEQWWPQADVLAHASAILHHGGFGTTMGAVVAGLPQLIAPIFSSDQAINGRHIAAMGAGRTVVPGDDLIGRAIAELPVLLEDRSYLARAGTAASQARALPDVSAAVSQIETLRR